MIRDATPADLSAVAALLREANLPDDDLDAPGLHLYVAGEDERVVGAIALERAGDGALLRSAVVEAGERNRGLGRKLVEHAERAALRAGLRRLVLLTDSAADWFAARGYQPLAREDVPPPLRALSQFTSVCPQSAACLGKTLEVTIWHNPNCGTSRTVLALLREAGIEPRVVEYLKTPPDRATLASVVARMGIPARELIREKGTPWRELGLDDPSVDDATVISRMLEQPILINRPVVTTPWGVKLCRPADVVRELI
jgi:arsenate reductase